MEVAQRGIVAFGVSREPGMPAEFRIGFSTVKQLKGSGAIGIEPGGDNRRLRSAHVVGCIVKQDTVSRLRKMEEEDEQGNNQSPEES